MSLMAWMFFRVRGYHPERVPAVGPVILAPNHFSFLDHFFLGVALRRKVHFMAKSQLFKPPMSWIYTHGGVFPVRRGFADEDAFITAVTVLDRGDTMAMYAEGGRSRTGELGEEAKRGIGRLALLSGAPIVPVAIVGSCARAQLEARGSSRRSASTTASRSPTNASRRRRATRSRPPPTPSSRRCASSTTRPTARLRRRLRRPRRRAACRGRAARAARPTASTAAPTHDRAGHAVGERLRRRVGAVGGEHRGQHGDAERAADLADRVGRARGLAGLLRADRAEHGVGRRREHQRHAGAGERRTGSRTRRRRGRRRRPTPASRSRSPAAPSPVEHQRARADAVARAGPRSARRTSASPVHGSVRRPASSGE